MSDKTTENLIRIFQPNGIDWLGDEISKDNPLTYHHITKKSCGGRKTINNGALLTKRSHRYLHDVIEVEDTTTYMFINYCFKMLNDSKQPPNESYYRTIDALLDATIAKEKPGNNKVLVKTLKRK